MNLPKFPFLEKKGKPLYYLSLIFRNDKLEAFIFEKIGDEMRVISQQEENFDDSLDKAEYEEILEIADKIISQGEDEAKLGDDINKTIFGLKETWVQDNKIKPEKLEILKKICTELGLTPVGFLTISEAIVGLLQKEEGAPPSAILCDVTKNNLTISLVRGGKIIETKMSEIHQSAAFTVDTLLKHFTNVEILPSRIVLLNEDEELVQEFVSHPWSKSLPFLHLPQITNLETGSMGKAFVLGIAKQFGAQVLTEFETPKPSSPIQQENETIEPTPITAESKSNIEYVSGDAQEFFGFVQGKDVSKIKPPTPEVAVPVSEEESVTEEIPEEVKIESEGRQIIPASAMLLLPKVMGFISQAFAFLKKYILKLTILKNLPIKNKGILYLAGPAILLLFLLLYYFLGLSATVVIKVDPKIVEKSQDITFGTNSDFKNNIIKGDFITVTEDGSTSGAATGKKQTGDKAKGTVTIRNFSAGTLTLPAKTKITGNGLNFLTLGDVTVASRSADAPGSNNVNAEAEKFGTEYNLPSKVEFTISGNSDLTAKNDNPFSGGTKKDITVFSKDDAQKLRDDLVKNLEEKAKSDLQGKLTANQSILSNFVDESLTKENFDKDVDAEAKTVVLSGTVSYESISYDKNEFQNYLKTLFGTDVDTKNVELSFENIKVKGTTVLATLKVKAKIFPNLNITDLAKSIAGKSFTQAQNELLSLPQVADVRISFSPNLFFFPKTLPRINKNIKIEILENG